MALKGGLQDMSLANLVQMLCLDQRQAKLTLKNQNIGEGVIFFERGEVVHAEIGSLAGEEAIYHLLGWTDGTFEMSNQGVIPDQTITLPWNHLLMEGMKKLDEQIDTAPKVIEPEPVLTPADIKFDEALENNLIQVFSQLEQLKTRLASKKSQKQPEQALRILVEIINQVSALTEILPSKSHDVNSLTQILVQSSEKYPTLRLLRVHNNQLSAKIVSQIYSGWVGSKAERVQTFNEIVHGILDVLARSCHQFVSHFRSASVVDQWQETSDIFLAELTELSSSIRF